MKGSRVVLMLLRLAIAVQLVVGVAMWLGYWIGLVNFHMAVGSIFVLLLWILAIMAMVQRRAVGLAVFAIVWGLVLAGFGMAQRGLLVGDLHWIIRVLHLVISGAAMPIAERLGRQSDVGAASVSPSAASVAR